MSGGACAAILAASGIIGVAVVAQDRVPFLTVSNGDLVAWVSTVGHAGAVVVVSTRGASLVAVRDRCDDWKTVSKEPEEVQNSVIAWNMTYDCRCRLGCSEVGCC